MSNDTPELRTVEAPDETAKTTDAKESRREVPMIVHRVPFVDGNGVQQVKEHGPMPVSEWPAYEKENNL